MGSRVGGRSERGHIASPTEEWCKSHPIDILPSSLALEFRWSQPSLDYTSYPYTPTWGKVVLVIYDIITRSTHHVLNKNSIGFPELSVLVINSFSKFLGSGQYRAEKKIRKCFSLNLCNTCSTGRPGGDREPIFWEASQIVGVQIEV